MLAILANETSAIIQFRLTQFLCYISPEERVAVEVKTLSISYMHSKYKFKTIIKKNSRIKIKFKKNSRIKINFKKMNRKTTTQKRQKIALTDSVAYCNI